MKTWKLMAKPCGFAIVSLGMMVAAMPAQAAPAKKKIKVGEVVRVDSVFGPLQAQPLYRVGDLLYFPGNGARDTPSSSDTAWMIVQKQCNSSIDGITGWRLPTGAELEAWLRDPDPAKEKSEYGRTYFTNNPEEYGKLEERSPADAVLVLRTGILRFVHGDICVHEPYGPYKTGKGATVAKSEKKPPGAKPDPKAGDGKIAASKPSSGAVLTATKQPEAKPLPQASTEQKGPPVAPVDPAPKTQKRIAKWNEQVLEVGKTEAEARAKVEAGRTKVIAEKTKNAPTWRVGSETPITCGPHQGQGTVFSCRKTITFNYEEEYYPGAKAPGGSGKTISR